MPHFAASSKGRQWFATILTLLSLFETVIAQSFDANSIDSNTREAWCVSQINTCSPICESAGSNVLDNENTCNSSDLAYACTCVNGFSPDMAKYTNTIPYFICQQVYVNCIDQNPNDAAGQKTCDQEQAAFCNGDSASDVTSVYHITQTATDGSKATSNITLTLVEAAATVAATTSSTEPSSSTPSTSSSSNTQSTPVTSTGSSLSTSSPVPSSKPSISTGALAAAIVVPIISVVLIALGLGIFLYRKRRAAKAKESTGTGFEKAELHGEAVKPQELPMQERFEMEGEGIPGEMQANEGTAHEMGSTSSADRSPGP